MVESPTQISEKESVRVDTLIKNAQIINEGRTFAGSVLISGESIAAVYEGGAVPVEATGVQVVEASGKWLLPGVIDDQVHFREPGLTHKGSLADESRAAVAGGVTSYMDMPNTNPQTTTPEQLEWKFRRAGEVSPANYSFFFGGTNDNLAQLHRLDHTRIPGLKLFLGSSTGNMRVDHPDTLRRFFSETNLLIAVHAEKEEIIQRNRAYYLNQYGQEALDSSFHPRIRSEEACYASSAGAVELALSLGTRLHLLHLSTAKELSLLNNRIPLREKQITGEVCVHHLWFSDEDYATQGSRIQWNPAIKTAADRAALRAALNDNTLDIVATDHAPHLPSEKTGNCLTAASGAPMIQHSLAAMLELALQGVWTKEKVVEKMAHHPADLFRIDRRGYIRPGYYADLVLVNPQDTWTVSAGNLLYKCKWSPLEGQVFHTRVWKTFVNGQLVYADGKINDRVRGMPLKYLV
ncbi:MAG: dihydroorotase [Tannerella sp.]|jgi:dihydroorotase|nr:dihydroorotase [Tannerella sp.]